VLLTQGSSQALDLAVRRLVRAGDAVLVDDPGYANLLFSLRLPGAQLVGVPRTPQGYDLPALERLIIEHRPKVFFTQPRLQSPTGSMAPLAHLHRVLQLAEAHDLTVVENDIYVDLDPHPRPRWPAWTSSAAWSTSAATPRPSRPTCGWVTLWRTRICWRTWPS
jgi:DNA-binding transcriptional MocR family regulator